MIQGATRTIDLVMYELEDKAIEADLAAARARGVVVRVLLSPGYEGEPSAINEAAYDALRARGAAVRWSPDYFALTHEKSLVVDGAQALIMSFNLLPKYYPTGRDFAIVDNDPHDISAMEDAFNADWQGSVVTASAGQDLVWSPGSRSAITALIDRATFSLDLYNEEMADSDIVSALIRAAARGVAVHIVMTYSPNWKSSFEELAAAGVSIRTYGTDASLYIHAKMIVADGAQENAARAFVGSENFSATSLDQNRELGIIVSNMDIIQSLEATFDHDWDGATPFKR
jgi:phosphatidylserine/phosphatidylglycerophosphate/cardiolipin synthase-like enzyme